MTRASPFPAALRVVQIVDCAGAADGAHLDATLSAGVTAVWLRDPAATGRRLYEAAGSLLLRCRRLDAALLVGDRVDVALAVGADGVQLGQRSVPVARVRPWYRGWIGASCHHAAEVASAVEGGADHVVLSPVFGVPDKGAALGVEGLRSLLGVTRVPAVALGGVEPGTVGLLRDLGLAGVAVIRALRDAADPVAAARTLATVTPG